MNLKDAKVLITGGNSGIGLESARMLLQAGAKVAICGRNQATLDTAAKELDCLAIQADVSQEEDVVKLVEKVISELGGYNVLINNAAYGYMSPLVNIELEKFNQMLATNLTGAMLVGRESARHFISQNTGNIINIASTAGSKGYPGGTPYVASKFALSGMTECWRAELRKHNIRVMQINPSEVQTNFAHNAGYQQTPSDRKLRAQEIAHMIRSVLEMDDRGFVTDLTVWATNPE